ncbi:hypothetical protein NM688_g3266 [Phlebia brevispora]|uniref:Uncharacterized protein n=1 Tax=Phlebia brevispora TaxID=194682 RepID=A0ACC1T661_9APHY|nr:hypothetical protein NM688_g3266 [Phlebia brevispora]
MPRSLHGDGEDEGILSSLSMFIFQVLSLAVLSWLFFLIITPRKAEDERVQRRRRDDSDEVAYVRHRERIDRSVTVRKKSKNHSTGTPSCCVRLPQELIDEIIDHLHNDTSSLRACALTSRNWAPRTQRHLHRILVIRRGGPDPYTLRFSPSLVRCVQHIIVRGNLCQELVHSPLSGRKEVERLDLENDPRQGSYTVTRAQLPALPGLRALSLRWVYFRTSRDMLEALSQFQELDTLALDLANFYFAFTSPHDVAPVITLPITTLRLKLRSMPVPINHAYRSQAVLHSAGKQLKHLAIKIDSFSPEPSTRVAQLITVLESLDLSANSSLQSLELAFRWTAMHFYSRVRTALSRRLAVVLLSQVHSGEPWTLTFHIQLSWWAEQREWLRCLDLRMLDHFAQPIIDVPLPRETTERILACATKLKALVLKLSLETDNEAFHRIEDHIRGQLPKLTERGILRIERCEESVDVFL